MFAVWSWLNALWLDSHARLSTTGVRRPSWACHLHSLPANATHPQPSDSSETTALCATGVITPQEAYGASVASRRAMTLIETLVAIAIIGVLIALVMPAVQAVRESGRKTICKNNLHQIGVALLGYEAARNAFPAGRDATLEREHSWATAILPYLEQNALYRQYDYNKPWCDGAAFDPRFPIPDLSQVRPGSNAAVAAPLLPIFRCPTGVDWPGCTDYGGNYDSTLTGLPPGFGANEGWSAGVLLVVNLPYPPGARRAPVTVAEVRDGTSNTFIVVEDADRPANEGGLWATGYSCLAHDDGPINSHQSHEIFSLHPGGAHVAMADGSARFLSQATDPWIVGALCTRRNGEFIGPSF